MTSTEYEQAPEGVRARLTEVKDQVVSGARDSVRQAQDKATASLGESRQRAAGGIAGIASAMQKTGEQLRQENQNSAANLVEALGRQTERVSTYLRDTDVSVMRDDLEELVRRQPGAVLGAAFALGMLATRFFRSGGGRPERREMIGSGREADYEYGADAGGWHAGA
jgi:hypothetical protein